MQVSRLRETQGDWEQQMGQVSMSTPTSLKVWEMLLTGELSPFGPRVVDAPKSEAPQPFVEQLPVPDSEAQEDAVDLVLGWRLRVGGSNMGRGLDHGSPHFPLYLCPSHLLQPQSRGWGPDWEKNWDRVRHFQRGCMGSLRWGKGRNHHASPLQLNRKPTERQEGRKHTPGITSHCLPRDPVIRPPPGGLGLLLSDDHPASTSWCFL